MLFQYNDNLAGFLKIQRPGKSGAVTVGLGQCRSDMATTGSTPCLQMLAVDGALCPVCIPLSVSLVGPAVVGAKLRRLFQLVQEPGTH